MNVRVSVLAGAAVLAAVLVGCSAPVASVTNDDIAATSLTVGACYDIEGDLAAGMDPHLLVPCSEPHLAEVAAVFTPDEIAALDPNDVSSGIYCEGPFEAYVGRSQTDSMYKEYFDFDPMSNDSLCSVAADDGSEITGSIARTDK